MCVYKPTDKPGVLMSSWTLANPRTEVISLSDSQLYMAVDAPVLSLNSLGGRDLSQYQFYKAVRVDEPVEVEGVWTVIGDDPEVNEDLGIAVMKDLKEFKKTREWGDHYSDYMRNDRVALQPGAVILMPVSGDNDLYALNPLHQDCHQLRRVNLELAGADGKGLAFKPEAQPIRSTNIPLKGQFDSINNSWSDDSSTFAHKADIGHMQSLVARGFMGGFSLAKTSP